MKVNIIKLLYLQCKYKLVHIENITRKWLWQSVPKPYLTLFFVIIFCNVAYSSNTDTELEIIHDKYHIDSINHLYVQNPSIGLVRLDSLRSRCESRNWIDCSQPRLEMVTALAYRYLGETNKSLRHLYTVINLTKGKTDKWSVWWIFMAYQFMSQAYLESEDWHSLGKTTNEMLQLASKVSISDFPWISYYINYATVSQAQVLASEGNIDKAIEQIELSRTEMSKDTSENGKSMAYQNYCNTAPLLANMHAKAEQYKQALHHRKQLLAKIKNEENPVVDSNYYYLTYMRNYASMSEYYYKLNHADSAYMVYSKAKEIYKRFKDESYVIMAFANYLSLSKNHNELDALLLPILENAAANKEFSKYIEKCAYLYISSLQERELAAEEVKWGRYLIFVKEKLQQIDTNNAYASFDAAIKSKQQEQIIEEQKTNNNRNLTNIKFLIIIIAFLLIISIITVCFWIKQKRKNKQLYEQAQQLNNESINKSQTTTETQSSPATPMSNADIIYAKTKEFLEDGDNLLNKNVSSKDIQLHCNVSYEALNDSLNSLIGMSCAEYITYLRLEHSCNLLSTTNMTVDAIAGESGFSSTRTYYRQFNEKYSVSPSEYRKLSNEG